MTGVVAFYDHTSIPGTNNVIPPQAGGIVVEELFCSGLIKYYHQPIGIVVANNHKVALEAATRVQVYYTNPTEKPLFNIADVLAAGATDRITVQTSVTATDKGILHNFLDSLRFKGDLYFKARTSNILLKINFTLNNNTISTWSYNVAMSYPLKKVLIYMRQRNGQILHRFPLLTFSIYLEISKQLFINNLKLGKCYLKIDALPRNVSSYFYT